MSNRQDDPLELMDDVERDQHRYAALLPDGAVAVTRPEWQSLRTAIEEQRGWMALQDEKHTECAENLVKAREELAQKDARIFELESAMLDMWKISQGGSISAAVMESVIDGVMGES